MASDYRVFIFGIPRVGTSRRVAHTAADHRAGHPNALSRSGLNHAPGMSEDFIQRGGFWVLGQGVLLCAVMAGGPIWRGQWQGLVITLCGVGLLLVSGALGLAGTVRLGRNLTPFPKPLAGARLVQSGIYGLVRHPLYTAVFCASAGWALVWRSWPALVAALALAPLFDAKARREERWLREKFPEYSAYEQRVRRFVPWIY
jgi:protein-S-isoprenylcysteine O-methyltransferase Ste14